MPAIKEFDELTEKKLKITSKEFSDLKKFALANSYDKQGNYRPVLVLKNDKLHAQNFVGILETSESTIIEILPKIDLAENEEETKKIFLNMLRTWRGTRMAQLNQTNINALRHFNMLEVFIRLFLNDLALLAKRGLARHYHLVEDNLPVLKGRIHFPQHIRANMVDRSKFYVEFDEFSANRPANRLIHLTIDRLKTYAKQPVNLQLLDQLKINFIEIPKSKNIHDDWTKHKVDRSMQHYNTVMQWVGIFLFGHGLTTFQGKHLNQSLLFPMEEIFEDFVAYAFRRYQSDYSVKPQAPRRYLAKTGDKDVFMMKPDISLMKDDNPQYILDTKWKRLNQGKDKKDDKHGISQSDMYQLFAYGKKYGCKTVALIYPKSNDFKEPYYYEFDSQLKLACLPFDVVEPENSVKKILHNLNGMHCKQ